MASVAERVILDDCCEDWILEYGAHYDAGTTFSCPECDTPWRAEGKGRFVRRSDEHAFLRRDRRTGEGSFPYLGAEDGREPIIERCCAKILLEHGAHLPAGEFVCPVDRTHWTVGSSKLHGLRVPTFEKAGLEEPLTIQPGRTRAFLVLLSRYSAPRE